MAGRHERNPEPRGLRRRVAGAIRFVRELFTSGRPPEGSDELRGDAEGGLGVREPRKPRPPSRSGGVALEAPPAERTDVRAIGEERD